MAVEICIKYWLIFLSVNVLVIQHRFLVHPNQRENQESVAKDTEKDTAQEKGKERIFVA